MPLVKNHHGIEIHVDGSGTFRATMDDSGEALTSKSLGDLEKVLDHKLLLKSRGQGLALACLNSQGEEFTITGIHLGNRAMLTKPTQTDTFHQIYPNTSSNKGILSRLVEAKKVIEEIEAELRPRAVKTQFGYGNLDAGDYPQVVAQLETGYQEAMEKSEPEK